MTHPTDVSRLHAEAVAGLVSSTVAPMQVADRYRVYVGEVTDSEADVVYPYLVVWPTPALRQTNTLAGYDGAALSTLQLTAAGISVDEALAALDRAAAGLHRRRPHITGRRCGLITQVPGAEPPQPSRDDRVSTPDGRPVFFTFALFTLHSTPTITVPLEG